ncbi:MAG: F0F1 ATP synthase subunit epsilon [Syntrophales bacterium]|jgi:F-type H+-transporting ATPase subunit epsilon|nr:F0F1 ATP synthase subunit epsilon [Syntrophales bacterium]HQN26378.1 F0F1 ATP synthase subunit epsilon [Syntrophales bacterium]
MKLRILLPAEVMLEEEVTKVVAEAENGSFCLLPHHTDFAATLAPGIFTYTTAAGDTLLAMDTGALIKQGENVLVSTRNAIRAEDLDRIKQVVEKQYQVLDEREKMARAASARLEADLIRRFMELNQTR